MANSPFWVIPPTSLKRMSWTWIGQAVHLGQAEGIKDLTLLFYFLRLQMLDCEAIEHKDDE